MRAQFIDVIVTFPERATLYMYEVLHVFHFYILQFSEICTCLEIIPVQQIRPKFQQSPKDRVSRIYWVERRVIISSHNTSIMRLFYLRGNHLKNRFVGGVFPIPTNKDLKIPGCNRRQTGWEIRIEISEGPIKKHVPCGVSKQLTQWCIPYTISVHSPNFRPVPTTVMGPFVTVVPFTFVNHPLERNGSNASTTTGHVVGPSVLTSTNRYNVCVPSRSKTPLRNQAKYYRGDYAGARLTISVNSVTGLEFVRI